jgi:hypothetical protein
VAVIGVVPFSWFAQPVGSGSAWWPPLGVVTADGVAFVGLGCAGVPARVVVVSEGFGQSERVGMVLQRTEQQVGQFLIGPEGLLQSWVTPDLAC